MLQITFFPALSREFLPYKPDPAPLLHICSLWGVQPNEVIMIGDSLKDDVSDSFPNMSIQRSLFIVAVHCTISSAVILIIITIWEKCLRLFLVSLFTFDYKYMIGIIAKSKAEH